MSNGFFVEIHCPYSGMAEIRRNKPQFLKKICCNALSFGVCFSVCIPLHSLGAPPVSKRESKKMTFYITDNDWMLCTDWVVCMGVFLLPAPHKKYVFVIPKNFPYWTQKMSAYHHFGGHLSQQKVMCITAITAAIIFSCFGFKHVQMVECPFTCPSHLVHLVSDPPGILWKPVWCSQSLVPMDREGFNQVYTLCLRNERYGLKDPIPLRVQRVAEESLKQSTIIVKCCIFSVVLWFKSLLF